MHQISNRYLCKRSTVFRIQEPDFVHSDAEHLRNHTRFNYAARLLKYGCYNSVDSIAGQSLVM